VFAAGVELQPRTKTQVLYIMSANHVNIFQSVKSVIGIDICLQAIEDAKTNANINGKQCLI